MSRQAGARCKQAQYQGVSKPESTLHCQSQLRHMEELLSLHLLSPHADEAEDSMAHFPVPLLELLGGIC